RLHALPAQGHSLGDEPGAGEQSGSGGPALPNLMHNASPQGTALEAPGTPTPGLALPGDKRREDDSYLAVTGPTDQHLPREEARAASVVTVGGASVQGPPPPPARPARPGVSPKTPPPGSSRPRSAGDPRGAALRLPDAICPSKPVRRPPGPEVAVPDAGLQVLPHPADEPPGSRSRLPGGAAPRARFVQPGRAGGRTPPRSPSGGRPALTGPTAAAAATATATGLP
ncbi:basic proline-rich protein-like, partial [Meles meles]|uniref:basic proline-rich protein-like n=1 Tax=Meles meles TaxID=9662 RepID=UPI001E69FA4C